MHNTKRAAVVINKLMSSVKGVACLGHRQTGDSRRRLSNSELVEIDPRDVLHRKVEPIVIFAKVVDLSDAAVVKSRQQAPLIEKHLPRSANPSQLASNGLERNEPLEPANSALASDQDFAHAADVELGEHFVAAQ